MFVITYQFSFGSADKVVFLFGQTKENSGITIIFYVSTAVRQGVFITGRMKFKAEKSLFISPV
jgi:hypothetical protein